MLLSSFQQQQQRQRFGRKTITNTNPRAIMVFYIVTMLLCCYCISNIMATTPAFSSSLFDIVALDDNSSWTLKLLISIKPGQSWWVSPVQPELGRTYGEEKVRWSDNVLFEFGGTTFDPLHYTNLGDCAFQLSNAQGETLPSHQQYFGFDYYTVGSRIATLGSYNNWLMRGNLYWTNTNVGGSGNNDIQYQGTNIDLSTLSRHFIFKCTKVNNIHKNSFYIRPFETKKKSIMNSNNNVSTTTAIPKEFATYIPLYIRTRQYLINSWDLVFNHLFIEVPTNQSPWQPKHFTIQSKIPQDVSLSDLDITTHISNSDTIIEVVFDASSSSITIPSNDNSNDEHDNNNLFNFFGFKYQYDMPNFIEKFVTFGIQGTGGSLQTVGLKKPNVNQNGIIGENCEIKFSTTGPNWSAVWATPMLKWDINNLTDSTSDWSTKEITWYIKEFYTPIYLHKLGSSATNIQTLPRMVFYNSEAARNIAIPLYYLQTSKKCLEKGHYGTKCTAKKCSELNPIDDVATNTSDQTSLINIEGFPIYHSQTDVYTVNSQLTSRTKCSTTSPLILHTDNIKSKHLKFTGIEKKKSGSQHYIMYYYKLDIENTISNNIEDNIQLEFSHTRWGFYDIDYNVDKLYFYPTTTTKKGDVIISGGAKQISIESNDLPNLNNGNSNTCGGSNNNNEEQQLKRKLYNPTYQTFITTKEANGQNIKNSLAMLLCNVEKDVLYYVDISDVPPTMPSVAILIPKCQKQEILDNNLTKTVHVNNVINNNNLNGIKQQIQQHRSSNNQQEI